MNRPGLMMYGQVVMAPGRVDTTREPFGINDKFWLMQTRVYCDGKLQHGVVAYDENLGHVLTQHEHPNGYVDDPRLQIGLVTALPRFVKFPVQELA